MRPPKEVNKLNYEIVGDVKRYDQRDQAMARRLLIPGTAEYEDYYSRHPELKEWDDETRRIALLARKRNCERNPVNEQFAPATFYGRNILGINSIVEGTFGMWAIMSAGTEKVDVDPVEMSNKIKAFGDYLGASKIRITELNQNWVYTNWAHPLTSEPYGKPVELNYKNIICIAVRHDPTMISNAIGIGVATEMGWRYT